MPSADDQWRSDVLDVVFRALASSDATRSLMVFKGARVLRERLAGFGRFSNDLDASFAGFSATGFAPEDPAVGKLITEAIEDYFSEQNPAVYRLTNPRYGLRRKSGPHPRGWDVYEFAFKVTDDRRAVQVLNELKIEIAAPEEYSLNSVSDLRLDGHVVKASTLERIGGEKPRAFLSSLPAYRSKVGHDPLDTRHRRAKDLYDFARICQHHPKEDIDFWRTSGQEFQLACKSRCIDCAGIATFKDDWQVTRETYEKDSTIPSDVSFNQAEHCLEEIVGLWTKISIVPFTNPLSSLT